MFFGELGEGAIQKCHRPFAIEFKVGRGGVGVGDLEFSVSCARGVALEGFQRLAGIAFGGGVAIAHVAEEMFYSREEIGTEATARRIYLCETIFFKKAREEFLGEIASGVVIANFAQDKCEDGRVVSFAKFRERGARFFGVAAGLEDASPLGGDERAV